MFKKILGCSLSIFSSGMICFGYPGVLTTYWQEQFNVTVKETGFILTFMLLALGITMFFSGKFHKRFGMHNCVLVGTSAYILSFVLLFFAQNIYWIYAWGFLSNIGCSFLYGPGLATGQESCPEKKGLISGILNLIFGISAAIVSPIFNLLLENVGYNFLNSIIIGEFAITGAISYFLLRPNKKTTQKSNVKLESTMTVKQALKNNNFRLLWFLWLFMGASGISMISLSKTYAVYLGVGGVLILTSFNLANGIIRIFAGFLSDKIGGRITGAVACGLAGVGYVLLSQFADIRLAALFAILVGIGFGTMFTVTGPLISELFGVENFGMIFGLTFIAYGFISGSAGPAVSSLILSKTDNNYSIVFLYLGVMAFIGMILMFMLKSKDKHNKKIK